MIILLQQIQDGAFLDKDGSWSQDGKPRREFQHCLQALSYSREHHLHNVQVVLQFPDDQYTIRIPIEISADLRG